MARRKKVTSLAKREIIKSAKIFLNKSTNWIIFDVGNFDDKFLFLLCNFDKQCQF